MNIAIAGGGTGGHIFPALAIARELEGEISDARVTFIGTAKGLEAKIIPKAGFDVKFIRSEGLVGKNMLITIRSALKVPVSIKDAFGILKAARPDVVLGVGPINADVGGELKTGKRFHHTAPELIESSVRGMRA